MLPPRRSARLARTHEHRWGELTHCCCCLRRGPGGRHGWSVAWGRGGGPGFDRCKPAHGWALAGLARLGSPLLSAAAPGLPAATLQATLLPGLPPGYPCPCGRPVAPGARRDTARHGRGVGYERLHFSFASEAGPAAPLGIPLLASTRLAVSTLCLAPVLLQPLYWRRRWPGGGPSDKPGHCLADAWQVGAVSPCRA